MTADRNMKSDECKMGQAGRFVFALLVAGVTLSAGAGCRQRMADQPYYRPYEESTFFKEDGRASRPIEPGTVHRGQYLESDPIATGLTAAEWALAYEYEVPMKVDAAPLSDTEKVKRAVGAPRYDPLKSGQPKVYVEEFPFAITHDDLKRGQDRYTIYCAACHGPLGNGQGKIWERGYLHPTSFHTAKVDATEATVSNPQGLGISRGFSLWGHTVPMDQAPIGYYFEVITKGYGGMPSYSAQIDPADRWKIIAYIRVLQMSQRADPAKLPPEVKKLLADAGGKK
jgi:mono/diheme cytochrome c family protein